MSRALGTTAFTFGGKPHEFRQILNHRFYGYDPRNSVDAVEVYANVIKDQVNSKTATQRRMVAILLGQALGDQS